MTILLFCWFFVNLYFASSPFFLVCTLPSAAIITFVKYSSEGANTYSSARIRSATPTGNIPEAPELWTPRYSGQNVGPQWCPL